MKKRPRVFITDITYLKKLPCLSVHFTPQSFAKFYLLRGGGYKTTVMSILVLVYFSKIKDTV